MTRVRVGVIGAGWWSQQSHLPSLTRRSDVDLVGIAEPDARRRDLAARTFAPRYTFATPEELLGAVACDAVIVSSPHAHHFVHARGVLRHGAHVLVEKPFTLAPEDAWELVRLARGSNSAVVIGYTYQFTEAARELRRAIHDGMLGDILCVSAQFASPVEAFLRGAPATGGPPDVLHGPLTTTYSDLAMAGGGQIQTQTTHVAGMLMWAAGQHATNASAHMREIREGVDLADAISFGLSGGGVGSVCSTGSLVAGQPLQQELRYYGTEGFALQDLEAGRVDIYTNAGEHHAFGSSEAYPRMRPAEALVELAQGRGENCAPPEPAADAVGLLDAAVKAARSGVGTRVVQRAADDPS